MANAYIPRSESTGMLFDGRLFSKSDFIVDSTILPVKLGDATYDGHLQDGTPFSITADSSGKLVPQVGHTTPEMAGMAQQWGAMSNMNAAPCSPGLKVTHEAHGRRYEVRLFSSETESGGFMKRMLGKKQGAEALFHDSLVSMFADVVDSWRLAPDGSSLRGSNAAGDLGVIILPLRFDDDTTKKLLKSLR